MSNGPRSRRGNSFGGGQLPGLQTPGVDLAQLRAMAEQAGPHLVIDEQRRSAAVQFAIATIGACPDPKQVGIRDLDSFLDFAYGIEQYLMNGSDECAASTGEGDAASDEMTDESPAADGLQIVSNISEGR